MRRTMMARDSQKQRVYDAEHKWERHGQGTQRFQHFDTLKECEKYIAAILNRKRVRDKYPIAKWRKVRVVGNGKKGHAASFGGRIRVSPAARNSYILLHETAHEILPRAIGHHWQYAEAMLFLVKQVLGKEEHDLLKSYYKAGKVRFRKPRTRNITPEQRAVLIDRMAKARAARKLPKPSLTMLDTWSKLHQVA